MSDINRERDIRKAELFLEAEKLEKQAHGRPEVKRDWLTAHCPKCGYHIQYVPTERWKGRLKCPQCGKQFTIYRLDDFVKIND